MIQAGLEYFCAEPAEAGAARRACWFAEQVQPHEPALRGYLARRFSDLHDLDDVVQEAYLRVWKAPGPIRNVRGLLFTAARNLALDAIRRRRASPFDEVSLDDARAVAQEQPGTADVISRRQEVDFLEAAVEALPPRCRETLTLQRIDGLPVKEIALRLGISRRTVDADVRKGLRRCAEYLEVRGVAP